MTNSQFWIFECDLFVITLLLVLIIIKIGERK